MSCWSLTGQCIASARPYDSGVRCFAWTQDGQRVLCGGASFLWDHFIQPVLYAFVNISWLRVRATSMEEIQSSDCAFFNMFLQEIINLRGSCIWAQQGKRVTFSWSTRTSYDRLGYTTGVGVQCKSLSRKTPRLPTPCGFH